MRRATVRGEDVRRMLEQGGRRDVPFSKLLLAGAAAFFAGTAIVNVRRARQAEATRPAEGRFVYVDGARLHYLDEGEGPPVLLLHGNGTMADDWVRCGVLPALAGQHRVVAIDRPGFGYSERPRGRIWTPAAQAASIERALHRLGVVRPIVVAHSFANLVALSLVLDRRVEVAGLVLVSGYFHPTLRADTFLLSGPAVPVLGDVLRHTLAPILGDLLWGPLVRKIFAPAWPSPEFRAFPRGLALRPAQLRAAAGDVVGMVVGAALLADRYKELDLPVTILAGEADEIVHFGRHSARLHEEIQGSELRSILKGGHMLHYTDPNEIVRAVERVMTRARPRQEERGAEPASLIRPPPEMDGPRSIH